MSVKIEDGANTPLSHIKDIKWLHNNEIKFMCGPSLNLIIGPNGSGKSTLLKLIAMTFHCEQGGLPRITHESIDVMDDFHGKNTMDKYNIKHDGSMCYYFHPKKKIGLMGGAFDDDFFTEGIMSLTRNVSDGMETIGGVSRIFKLIDFKNKIKSIVPKDPGWNDVWIKRLKKATRVIMNTNTKTKKMCPTILLDEPDASLSLTNQFEFWKLILDVTKKVQVIMVSHSFLAMHQNCFILESQLGYKEQVMQLRRDWSHQIESDARFRSGR